MIEVTGNIWDLAKDYDAVVITTNGSVNSGAGKLRWEEVKPMIEPILDDRFYVCCFGGKE